VESNLVKYLKIHYAKYKKPLGISDLQESVRTYCIRHRIETRWGTRTVPIRLPR